MLGDTERSVDVHRDINANLTILYHLRVKCHLYALPSFCPDISIEAPLLRNIFIINLLRPKRVIYPASIYYSNRYVPVEYSSEREGVLMV